MATKKKNTSTRKTSTKAKTKTPAKKKAQVVKATATEIPKTLIAAEAFRKDSTKVTQKDLVEAMALKREIRRIKEGRKSASLTKKVAEDRLEKVLAKMKVSLLKAKHYARIRGIFTNPAGWEPAIKTSK